MKISWIFWWTIGAIEILSFIGFTIFLWTRNVDASGAIQTTELKWINVAVLGTAYLMPFIIQIIWLIINLFLSRRQNKMA
ncbi:DUF3923 family protein [Staphylococcus succinus]|uniref:DUF3923 domain-containing protein n=1 Tax=Staphylococcus succinus TaxID=61015 RepID=A0ABX5IJC9_9STAP|nr:DUF3923 family protein [Staphylococcus succinus]PTI64235.1 DUF3923 domain-containing protein [Staphylococcus succinus]RIN34991.1 DUF3923 family protein [Staphylococcus succinus]